MDDKTAATTGVTHVRADTPSDSLRCENPEKTQLEPPSEQPSVEDSQKSLIMHGPRLWLLLAGLYLGIYLLALESTMLSTVIPTLTDEFHTVADISWYESAYVLPVCALTPIVGKLYEQLRIKHVYLAFIIVFEIGLVICAIAKTSQVFVVGRAINGLGAAGQFNGCMLIMSCVCDPKIRPIATAFAISMMSIGSITGPNIAGVITGQIGWRWCFWILLPMGAAIILIVWIMRIPEQSAKPPVSAAIRKLPHTIDPVGFILFVGSVVMLLLALTWGGARYAWSSATMIGLLCGAVAAGFAFCAWIWHKGDNALIPPSCMARRCISVGSIVIFLQGGASQALPYFLPLWFQAVKGDNPSESAVHLLPSLVTMIVALIIFGTLLRKVNYLPPWAIVGSLIASIGSGLYTTFGPDTSVGAWIGYQIFTTLGRGFAFQVPISSVQELVPLQHQAVCMSVLNLFLQLGTAVSVSASQTIFDNQLPDLLHRYAPTVNATMVLEAGATNVRPLIHQDQLDGFLKAYNQSVVDTFYFPTAACVLACLASFGLDWTPVRKDDEKETSVCQDEEKETSVGKDEVKGI